MTTLALLLQNPTAERLARAHLHFLWQGFVVAIVAWLLLAALRRSSANARYLSSVIVLGVLAACPVVTFALIAEGTTRPAKASVADAATNTPFVATTPGDTTRDVTVNDRAPASRIPDRPALAQVSRLAEIQSRDRVSDVHWDVGNAWVDAREWLNGHLGWVFVAWLLGVWLFSLRLLVGWVAIERLKRVGALPVGGDLRMRIDELARRLGITRQVQLLHSALAEVPAVIGCLKPMILLPVQACTGLTAEQLEAILAHELAHIKRCDYAVNCVQVVVETLLFYHPVVWWVSRAIRRERERCCDDVAVSLCGDRFVYVRALTAMEGLRGRAPGLAMAAGSHGGPLRRRVLRLLSVPNEPAPTAARWLAAAAVVAVAIALGTGFPWPVTAADGPASSPLVALGRDQIPAYELEVAGAVDPANASPSLVAILGDSRLKMMAYVGSLVFTADGRSLISAANHEIAFWDPRTGRQERVLGGHTDTVVDLAISRDGQTLVSGSRDHWVKVWDVVSGKERLSLKGHRNSVSAVAISPDGKLVASGDIEVRLWDISGGRQRVHMKVLGQHGRSVGALAFAPDAQTLASAGDDGKIDIWEVSTGQRLRTLSVEPVRERWKAVAFSPDGSTLAGAGFDHGLVFWDAATWAIRHKVPEQDRYGAEALAFTGDGRRLAVSLGAAARMIDVATGNEVRRFPKQPVGMNAVAVSLDGATLATTGMMIKLWDLGTGEEKTPNVAGHAGSIESVAFSPDGTALATASADYAVKLWDLANRRERMTLDGHANNVQSVAFSPDGKLLASLGFHPELILWDASTGKRLRTWKGEGDLGQRVRFSPDGRRVAAETLARIAGRQVELWEVTTGKPVVKLSAGYGSYVFSPDGKKLIFAGESGRSPQKRTLLVWDIAHDKVEQTIEDGLLPSRCSVAALSPDGRLVALAGWDYEGHDKGKPVVLLWGLAEGRPLYRLDQSADHLAFSPDGRTLLGVGRDGNAQVWDPRNGTLRETIRVCEAGHFAIRDMAFAPDSRHFAAGLGNGTARIFRLRPAPERVETRDPLPIVAAQPDPPIDLWKRLIDKAAPELEITAWAGGSPVRLADLRKKHVLLHFWGVSSERQMAELMALHERFAEQGLVIIAIQPNWGVTTVEKWQARAIRQREWGDRALPFQVALDGGGATPIAGTDAKAQGATYAAFGIQDSRHGTRLPPINLLIGPDGKVLAGFDQPRSLERELEARMGVKAKVPAWRDRFDGHYALADGKVLKHVGPPYPPERSDYLLYSSRGGPLDPDRSQVFRWEGRLRHWGGMGMHRLEDVLGFVLKFRRGEFEGPAELLAMPISGDWIIRPGAPKTDLLKSLETILADELKKPIHFVPHDVEREVIVAKGRFQFHPLGDLPNERFVHLGTESLVAEDGGGGGSGSLTQMLDWLGNRVSRLAIDETGSPNERVQWSDHLARPMNEIAANTDEGRALLKRLLENVAKQTSLTFHHERRRVTVWFVSRER